MKLSLTQKILIGLILALAFILMILVSRGDSLTVDELVHIPAGYLHVWQGDYSYNSEHPPLANDLSGLFVGLFNKIKLPAVAPGDLEQYQYGEQFIYQSGNQTEGIIFWGRLPIILLTLGLIYLVFLWANQVWGFRAGLVAMTLTAFCPNILTHGHLATTDLMVTFAYVLNFYLLRQFMLDSRWSNALWLGLGMGLVLLSKFSGLIALPLDIIIYLIFLMIRRPKSLGENIAKFIVSLGLAFLLVWLVYLFSMRHQWEVAFQAYGLNHFSDGYFINLIKWLTSPLKFFWDGFNLVRIHDILGHLSFLNGQLNQFGHWYYFPLAFWYKTPIPTLMLLFLVAIYSFRSKQKNWEKILIILPVLVFFLVSLKGHIDIGLRHILPVYPLFYIFIGQLAASRNLIWRWLTYSLVIATIIVSLSAFPQYLAYFNRLAGGTEGGRQHLADSNLDWGQNVKRLQTYLNSHPEIQDDKLYFLCYDHATPLYYGIKAETPPLIPSQGIIILCATQYIFAPVDHPEFEWFTQYPADEVVAKTIYIWTRFKQ